MRAECVKTYALKLDHHGNIIGHDNDDPGRELLAIARKYQADHPKVSLSEALERLKHETADLRRRASEAITERATGHPTPQPREITVQEGQNGADKKIHRLALERMEQTSEAYPVAVQKVLDADPTLKAAYASCYGQDVRHG